MNRETTQTAFIASSTVAGAAGGGFLGGKIGAMAGFVISSVIGAPMMMIELLAVTVGEEYKGVGEAYVDSGGDIGLVAGAMIGTVLGASTAYFSTESLCDIYNRVSDFVADRREIAQERRAEATKTGAAKPQGRKAKL